MQQPINLSVFAKAFEKQLESVDNNSFSDIGYCNRYLTHLLAHKKYYIAIYADLLRKMLVHTEKNISEIILVDYGAGSGLLGLFAKCCGFKKVYINDMDINFIHAAQKLAGKLNIHPDGYIHGDINSVHNFFKNEKPHAIVGTDVIEHIYDLPLFFKTVKEIDPFMLTAFTTGSNPENYFKVCKLKKIQVKDEFKGSNSEEMFGDEPQEAFVKQRTEIIKSHFTELSNGIIDKLATATRGKIKSDIITMTQQYIASGKLQPALNHSTNTCDPISGSWTERIISLKEYTELFQKGGFSVEFYPGFYNPFEGGIIKKLLNALIIVFGKRISPFIILIGKYK